MTELAQHLEALGPKLAAHLSQASGAAVEVLGITPLVGGACQDNLRVDARFDGTERTLVLRGDAAQSLVGSLSRDAERRVIDVAVAAGVKTPPARWPALGILREGAGAYFMDWREGVAIGRKVVRDEALADARAGLAAELAAELVKVHAVTPASAPQLCEVLGPAPTSTARRLIDAARETLEAHGEARPALEYALSWLERHEPEGEVTLAHGDFRTGNFLVAPSGLSAVLDWEFAHWGTPAEDVAWLCVRDWRFGKLKLPAGGVATREAFVSAYREAGGAPLDPQALHFWEVAGNVRWATGCLHQGRRYRDGEHDLELIAIARRAIEMEFEALRLIETGPHE